MKRRWEAKICLGIGLTSDSLRHECWRRECLDSTSKLQYSENVSVHRVCSRERARVDPQRSNPEFESDGPKPFLGLELNRTSTRSPPSDENPEAHRISSSQPQSREKAKSYGKILPDPRDRNLLPRLGAGSGYRTGLFQEIFF